MLYGVGMWAFCAQHIVLRAFYSISDVRTPLRISCVLVPFNLILSIALVWFEPIREAAFAIASSITASINVVVGLVILQRSTNVNILNRSGAVAIGKMLLAAGAAMASVWLVRPLLFALQSGAPGLATDLLQRAVDVGGSLATGVLVCFAAALLLGLPEPRLVLARWRKRRDSETP
jgi:putative peptidoglycan lipid II flippase